MTDIAPEKHIIRTSDRGTFKFCRLAWDLGSKIRRNYEPNMLPRPLAFGTSIHKGLEVFYDPARWNIDKFKEVNEALALKAFADEQQGQVDKYLALSGREDLDDELAADYRERSELGKSMLQNYFKWSYKNDDFEVIYVEVEFEVPVIVPGYLKNQLPKGFWCDQNGHLYKMYESVDKYGKKFTKPVPVVYQGRLDAIVKDRLGRYWIIDHKTASSFQEDVSHFDNDEQTTSYCWAIQHQLGIPIAGVIFTEMYKGKIDKPIVLQRGGLSKNKQQDTTYDLYLQTIHEMGLNEEDYAEFLNYLKYEGKQMFRRIQQHRNAEELRIAGERIAMEAIDMLNDPMIYPRPSREYRCKKCMFRQPCLAMQEGSSAQFLLNSAYHQREQQSGTEINMETMQ